MDDFKATYGKLQATKKTADQIATWMQQRYYWGDFLAELRRALIRSEDDVRKKLSAQKPGVEVGIWIEQITLPNAANAADGSAAATPVPMPGMDPRYNRNPYNVDARYRGQTPPPPPTPQPEQAAAPGTSTNSITLICRAVSLTSVDSSANPSIAYAVETEIKNSPLVDPVATQLSPNISQDDPNGTFSFTVNVTLKTPLNF